MYASVCCMSVYGLLWWKKKVSPLCGKMTALLLPVMECKKMIFWFLEQAKNRNFYCSTIEHNGDAIEIKRKLQSDWIFDWTMCTHSDSLYCAALPHIQKQNSFSICFPFDYWLLRHYFLFFSSIKRIIIENRRSEFCSNLKF